MGITSFDNFMREIEAEAEAEGPGAVAQLRALESRFRRAAYLMAPRRRRAVSQRQLATLTGVSVSEISRIERGVGSPTEGTLDKLASAPGRANSAGSHRREILIR
jgi:ribosome-binding protein aMBF1 (putative translation factor)